MDILQELEDIHDNACAARRTLGIKELERQVRAKAAEGYSLLLIETEGVMKALGPANDVKFADVLECFLVAHPTLRARCKVEGIYLKIKLRD